MVRRAEGIAQSPVDVEALDETTPEEVLKKVGTEKTRKSVYIYIATLFLVVLLFTLLSYFIQQRNNSEISSMNEKYATAQQNIENLQDTNLQLQSESDADKKQIADLQTQISGLEKQLSDMQQQWQADVQNVRDSDQAAYSTLQQQYNELQEQYRALAKKYGIKVKIDD
jgi:DNA repair exonuclease SbcCD ATPase subunit